MYDYAKAINELEDAGLTQTEIALKIGCTQGRVSQIKNTGQGVRHEVGVKLTSLCILHNVALAEKTKTPSVS